MNFQGQGFQMLKHYKHTDKDTHIHTDRCDRTHYHVAFAGGNNKNNNLCK